jgi:hypothetical protein
MLRRHGSTTGIGGIPDGKQYNRHGRHNPASRRSVMPVRQTFPAPQTFQTPHQELVRATLGDRLQPSERQTARLAEPDSGHRPGQLTEGSGTPPASRAASWRVPHPHPRRSNPPDRKATGPRTGKQRPGRRSSNRGQVETRLPAAEDHQVSQAERLTCRSALRQKASARGKSLFRSARRPASLRQASSGTRREHRCRPSLVR